MGMSLFRLMEQIGIAVQNANAAIEQYASEIYLKQGYVEREKDDQEDGDENAKAYEPITFLLDMPTENSKRKMRVPVTALMHHSSLQLEQVDVKLRFHKDLTNAVIDRFGKKTMLIPEPDGEHFTFVAKVAVSPIFLSWVIGFGSKAQILYPDSVKESCRALCQEVLDQY